MGQHFQAEGVSVGSSTAPSPSDPNGRHWRFDQPAGKHWRQDAVDAYVGNHLRGEAPAQLSVGPRLLNGNEVLTVSALTGPEVTLGTAELFLATRTVDREPKQSRRSARWTPAGAVAASLLTVFGGAYATDTGVSAAAIDQRIAAIAGEVSEATPSALRADSKEEPAGVSSNPAPVNTTPSTTTTSAAPTTTTVLPTTAPPVTSTSTTKPKARPRPTTTIGTLRASAAMSKSDCSSSRSAAEACWGGLLRQYPWDYQTAFNIMWCESRGNPSARNSSSSATGLFQILGGPVDPIANVAQAYAMYERRGWQPWVCKG